MDQAKLAKMQQSVRIGELFRSSRVFNVATCTKTVWLTSSSALRVSYSLQFSLGLPSPVFCKLVYPTDCSHSCQANTSLGVYEGFTLMWSNVSGKGTPRRKMKKVHKSSGTDDKKLQTSLKKLNVQPIQAIEEVNMFKEDGNVIHFAAPKGVLVSPCSISTEHPLR